MQPADSVRELYEAFADRDIGRVLELCGVTRSPSTGLRTRSIRSTRAEVMERRRFLSIWQRLATTSNTSQCCTRT